MSSDQAVVDAVAGAPTAGDHEPNTTTTLTQSSSTNLVQTDDSTDDKHVTDTTLNSSTTDASTTTTTTTTVDHNTDPTQTQQQASTTSSSNDNDPNLKHTKPTDSTTTTTTTKTDNLTLRALVSSREAGVIIGRGGSTIANVRTEAGVKAGVSKVVQGVADRILSVGGSIDRVAKAYALVAQTILDNPGSGNNVLGTDNNNNSSTSTNPSSTTTIRLLISHLLIGSVIGKGGTKIRQIQETSGTRMIASKEMLPQSTERIVEITGTSNSIELAVQDVLKCLLDDWERSQGTVLYHPGSEGGVGVGGPGLSNQFGMTQTGLGNGYPHGVMQGGVLGGMTSSQFGGRRMGSGGVLGTGLNPQQQQQQQQGQRRSSSGHDFGLNSSTQSRRTSGHHVSTIEQDPNFREQKISIPADMVGCIIGRAGTKINEIRRLSGSRITIAKTPHDETGERLFVIAGLPDQNEKALYLLYNQLELEKNRRLNTTQDDVTNDVVSPQEQQQA
ncbi:RNA binding protein, heterogenous nuclear RNP-K like protein [Microbotryomycetes sp. JL221]|nr:RNA binding protein, heterogenous nuclear RNP-K like protein [Microbotryomycetes sp. JL221]